MKKSNPAKLIFSFLGLATFASLVGTVSGTLAWYTYSTRATVSYSGTSVTNTVQLQIGIASPDKVLSVEDISNDSLISEEQKEILIPMFEEFWNVMEETKWNDDNNYYYFAPVGSGLTSLVINAYLKSNGYATNSLIPVTSGSYSRGDNFVLKESPNPDYNRLGLRVADKSYFATIPFVFRVIRSNTVLDNDYVENSELWLTDAQVRASSGDDGEIYKAIRMYVNRDSSYEDDFILNPSATRTGDTVVGGLLDLTRDNYYDYDDNNNEIIYGEFESIDGIQQSYSGADEIADINGTGKTVFDTFTAKHRNGINYYNNYNNCVFKKANYECLNSIAPIKDQITGALCNQDESHPSSVCKTGGSDKHYLAHVDFTVYLEGWDHTVIDEEKDHFFDLGLTFEINKLGE